MALAPTAVIYCSEDQHDQTTIFTKKLTAALNALSLVSVPPESDSFTIFDSKSAL